MRQLIWLLALLLLPTILHAEDSGSDCLYEGLGGQVASGTVQFESFADPRHPGVFISGYKLVLVEWHCYLFKQKDGGYGVRIESQLTDWDNLLTEVALIGWGDRTPTLKSLLGKTVRVTGTMQSGLGLRYVVIPQIAVQSIELCEMEPSSPAIPKCQTIGTKP